VLIFALFLTVIAYQSVALLLFVTGFDYARSLSLGAVYTAPAFAFLGITFPIYSMNDFALAWRDILPLSHYLQIQISQANYGADIWLESGRLMILASFLVVLIPVVIRFKSYLSKEVL
jgi:ABC-2 type transport system permease protein